MHVFIAVLVFLSMATLTKHLILSYESYFFIFALLCFLCENIGKIALKFKPHFALSKNTKKWSRMARFGSPNCLKLASESSKIHEILKKTCFLTCPFFEQISRREKTRFCQFLVSKLEGGRHEPGPMGREPEGGFHPPWRVITTSQSETEWNVETFVL